MDYSEIEGVLNEFVDVHLTNEGIFTGRLVSLNSTFLVIQQYKDGKASNILLIPWQNVLNVYCPVKLIPDDED